MQKDLDELLFNLGAHSDPYQKKSEDKFNLLVDSIRNKLSVELDEFDLYKNLSTIISSIKDGHSSLNMPRFYMNNIRKNNGALPLEFFLTNSNELYIVDAFTDTGIPLGSKIVAIEGKSINVFIYEVSPHISYEIESFRNHKIERDIETYLYLVFKKSKDLEFTYSQTDTLTKVVQNMDYKEWKKNAER